MPDNQITTSKQKRFWLVKMFKIEQLLFKCEQLS